MSASQAIIKPQSAPRPVASAKRKAPGQLHLRAALTLLMLAGAAALVLLHLALAHSQAQSGAQQLPFQQGEGLCRAGGAVCGKASTPATPPGSSSLARRPASLGLLLGGADQCSSSAGPHQQAPLVCAHGGSTALHPPNTAAAYEAALAAGAADCMEVDASLTSDLQLVAVHDRDLQALLRQPGAQVRQFTWQQLQGLSWPGGERLLSVAEAVALVQDRVQLLIVDVKSLAAPGAKVVAQDSEGSDVTEADALLTGLQQLRLGANSCVWAKSDELVLRAHKAGIGGSAGYAFMRDAPAGLDQPLRLEGGPQVVAAHHGALTAPLVQTLRDAGKRVFAWTVDAPGDVRRLLDLGGVAGIVTNDPAGVRRVIDQATASTSCSRQTAEA